MNQIVIRGLRKIGLLRKLNFHFNKRINRRTYTVPLLSGNGQQNFVRHEEWMEHVLQLLHSVKPGSFVDVGANVGQTLLKIKSIDPDIPYYGFEPNPTCVYYLNELIATNQLKNTLVFPVAIAEKPGIVKLNFYYDSDTDSAASVVDDFKISGEVRKTVFVPCFSMEYFTQFIDPFTIATVKIDVEGAESDVLKGLQTFINASRPFLIVEILPVYSEQNRGRLDRQNEIEEILTRNNYSILRIKKTKDNLFSSLELIDTIGIHSQQEWCDYVFCPKEKVATLLAAVHKE